MYYLFLYNIANDLFPASKKLPGKTKQQTHAFHVNTSSKVQFDKNPAKAQGAQLFEYLCWLITLIYLTDSIYSSALLNHNFLITESIVPDTGESTSNETNDGETSDATSSQTSDRSHCKD